MSMLVSFVLSFFPGDVSDEILNLIGSVSVGFPSYSNVVGVFIVNCRTVVSLTGSHPPPSLAAHGVMHPGARLCV